jgi:VLTF3-like late transcription factor
MSVVEDHSQPKNTMESRKERFEEYLSKYQASDTYAVPQHILDAVRGELDKVSIKERNMLEIKDIKQILKRLSFTNYCDDAPAIRRTLKGLPPFRMSLPVERFRVLFEAIQGPFELVKKQRRTTQCFISYDYILHKFAQLLYLEDHIGSFPLTADPNKLRSQDLIWEEICGPISRHCSKDFNRTRWTSCSAGTPPTLFISIIASRSHR